MLRFTTFGLVAALALFSLIGLFWSGWFLIPLGVFGWLTGLGVFDVTQRRRSILRNYPVLGHMRFMFEGIRPEIRQYLIESDQDEEPFSRDKRSIVYQRAKGVEDKRLLVRGRGSTILAMNGSPIRSRRNTSRTTIFAFISAGLSARRPTMPRSTTSRR